ncbi:MAG: hypothetical protein JMDDDDMK_03474 [Acidobacteria bacterium]|nr:hypothetical protein [Acidobacteriota bacterium]
MHDVILSVSYESLGKILEQLQESPEIKASPELAERIRNAILFHRQISTDWQGLLKEHRELKKTVSDLTREPGERVCGQGLQNQFSKYEEMRDQGANPQGIYLAATEDGYDGVGAIRILRWVFDLSLQEAQEIILQAQSDQQRRAA